MKLKLPKLFREETKAEKRRREASLSFRERMSLVKDQVMALIDGKARELHEKFEQIDKEIEEERREMERKRREEE